MAGPLVSQSALQAFLYNTVNLEVRISSLIFQYAEPGAVGDIVGVRLMLNNFARIVAPTIMGIALDFMTGSVFLSWIGVTILVSVGIALWLSKHQTKS